MTRTTTAQHGIGSPFSATSTAADVLDGIDLTGKLVVMRGGHSGIGLEATRALVDAGAHVVVPARRPDVAREALAGTAGTNALFTPHLDTIPRDSGVRASSATTAAS
ncbi:oxidoreductase [Pseudonocardia sp. N23]|nr:oxidoreductase [Pseudonocardia sp. N23]